MNEKVPVIYRTLPSSRTSRTVVFGLINAWSAIGLIGVGKWTTVPICSSPHAGVFWPAWQVVPQWRARPALLGVSAARIEMRVLRNNRQRDRKATFSGATVFDSPEAVRAHEEREVAGSGPGSLVAAANLNVTLVRGGSPAVAPIGNWPHPAAGRIPGCSGRCGSRRCAGIDDEQLSARTRCWRHGPPGRISWQTGPWRVGDSRFR